jgi:ABC-type xylose transport system permease subunit
VFNGLILVGVEFFYQLVVTGVVLALAVTFNEAVRART